MLAERTCDDDSRKERQRERLREIERDRVVAYLIFHNVLAQSHVRCAEKRKEKKRKERSGMIVSRQGETMGRINDYSA